MFLFLKKSHALSINPDSENLMCVVQQDVGFGALSADFDICSSSLVNVNSDDGLFSLTLLTVCCLCINLCVFTLNAKACMCVYCELYFSLTSLLCI